MNWLNETLSAQGLGTEAAHVIVAAAGGIALLIGATIAGWITRRIILRVIERIAATTRSHWDDVFVSHKVFDWLAHLVPAILIDLAAPLVFARYPALVSTVETAASLYMAVVVLLALNASLNASLAIYQETRLAKRVPLKPLVQVLKAILFFAGAMTMIAALIGKSPTVLFSGLGAFTAVLLLVFRDPILGLAAGIQLVSNNMVRKGDWIEVPKYGADGDVVDVSLTTVSVQNFDKTISTIPTYSLLTDTFRNWRGMEESGGRRIKRALNMDMNTVRFVDDALLERMRRVQVLRDYLDEKLEELTRWNREQGVDESSEINGRRLTNLGTFRAYLQHYLRHHPMVHPEMTFLVRQLAPTSKGVPLEVYVFSKDQNWVNYEAIQADIFDHILAVVPHFELRAFQEPTGADIRALRGQAEA